MKPQVQEDISPNLIPMIDIMFLLLLFFMLGADMGQRELEPVRPPKADSAEKDNPNAKENRLTLNVYHHAGISCAEYAHGNVCREERHWRVGIKGEDYTEAARLEKRLREEADRDRKVMIRADAGAPYGLAQRAMLACAKAGLYKIAVGAARPATERKRA